MRGRSLVIAGAALGFTGVALGAFGAHALQAILSPQELEWWHTATAYQLPHAGLTVGLGFASLRGPRALMTAGWLIACGTLVFSGSLYALALTDFRMLGAVTPLGGLLLLAGWTTLAWAMLRAPKDASSNDAT